MHVDTINTNEKLLIDAWNTKLNGLIICNYPEQMNKISQLNLEYFLFRNNLNKGTFYSFKLIIVFLGGLRQILQHNIKYLSLRINENFERNFMHSYLH